MRPSALCVAAIPASGCCPGGARSRIPPWRSLSLISRERARRFGTSAPAFERSGCTHGQQRAATLQHGRFTLWSVPSSSRRRVSHAGRLRHGHPRFLWRRFQGYRNPAPIPPTCLHKSHARDKSCRGLGPREPLQSRSASTLPGPAPRGAGRPPPRPSRASRWGDGAVSLT